MNKLSHEVLLALAYVSQMSNPDLIRSRFIESLNGLDEAFAFEFVDHLPQGVPEHRVLRIATLRSSFGYVVMPESPGVSEAEQGVFRSAFTFLAVLLENREQARALQTKNESLLKEIKIEKSLVRTVLDTLPVGVWVADGNGAILMGNAANENILTGTRYAGKAWWPDAGRHIKAGNWGFMRAIGAGETVTDQEIDVECFDGARKTILHSAAPLLDDEGQVAWAVAVNQDITERKQAEKRLQDQNQFIQTILDNLPIGLAVNYFDKGTAAYMNKQFEAIYGWPAEDLRNIGTFFEMVYPDPEYRQKVQSQVLHDIRSGDPEQMQWDDIEVTTKTGDKRIVNAKNIPLFEQNFMISTVQDITTRKRAEEALRTSHERFLKVLNCIDATVYVADMNTHEILFMNRHMVESFGRDMTGDICWQAFRGEEGPCPHCTNDRLVDENGRPADVCAWQGRNPVTGRWYINYDRAIEWIDGRLVRLQIATDITEFKKMETALRQAQKMEAIGTLAGGIAHEFNNMLGIILGNTELALDDVPEWNPAVDFIREIRTASLRARDVVKKLLSVARKAPSSKKPLRIGAVVGESLALLGKTIPETIEIRQNLFCTTETILGDPTGIDQILINLCTNAVHAIGDAAGVLDVRLETTTVDDRLSDQYDGLPPGEYVELTVADTGKGIDPDIMERIFDPYFTTKDVDEGLGMGLAVVRGIVKKHDGAISVESRPGRGTVVTVWFPLAEALDAAKRTAIG